MAPDLQAAKRWYSDVLGRAPYFDQPFYVGFAVGGFELGLLPDATPGTAGPQPPWGVADAHAAHARLIALGAKPLDAVTEVGEGIKVAAVIDPSGNRLGIIENPHFGFGQMTSTPVGCTTASTATSTATAEWLVETASPA